MEELRFKIGRLLGAHTGATRYYEIEVPNVRLGEEIHPEGPLHGWVQFMRSVRDILVTGDLEMEIGLACVRCLEPVTQTVAVEIEESFRPSVDVTTGASLPIVDGTDRDTLIDGQQRIDLTEIVRQDILLAAPMHLLCRPDCAGLCPQCGANLNDGPCGCARPDGDPRLTVLKDWMEEKE